MTLFFLLFPMTVAVRRLPTMTWARTCAPAAALLPACMQEGRARAVGCRRDLRDDVLSGERARAG